MFNHYHLCLLVFTYVTTVYLFMITFLTIFTRVYLCLPMFTLFNCFDSSVMHVYLCLSKFIPLYLVLHLFTYIYSSLPMFTTVFSCMFMYVYPFIRVYLCLLVFNYV